MKETKKKVTVKKKAPAKKKAVIVNRVSAAKKEKAKFVAMQLRIVEQFRDQGMHRMHSMRWLVRASVADEDLRQIMLKVYPPDGPDVYETVKKDGPKD